jgi:putative transposase
VKYAWIAEHTSEFPLEKMCGWLGVSTSGYAAWKSGGSRRQRLSDAQLLALIEAIHRETKGAYGSPRIHDEIRDRGLSASKARVERLMRENGIRARHKRRFKATTDSKHSLPVAENLLGRRFQPAAPNQTWTADITYLATAEGWLYLAVVIDLFDRAVIGWSMKDRMKTDLVLDALTMAYFRRRPAPGVLHHSDRGSQYASHAYREQLAAWGMTCSMSRKGNCWDNAPTESFFNSLKNERVHGTRYATRAEARADVFEYIEQFYNRSRRHSALAGKSPAKAFKAWLESQQQQQLAA